jgi:hypothetical protein
MCNCKKSSSTSRAAAKQVAAAPAVSSAPVRSRRSSSRRREAPVAPIAEPLIEIEGETFADKCQTFAYMLGLDEPVRREVLEAAIDYPAYARSLMAARDKPERLSDLLHNPPLQGSSEPLNNFTNSKLVAKASSALMKWALSGFPTVSKSTLEKRENACLACPNLIAPSSQLQRITASSVVSDQIGRRTGNKSCSACGCVITNKIRLSTESCPVASQENPALNRWGEELKTDTH